MKDGRGGWEKNALLLSLIGIQGQISYRTMSTMSELEGKLKMQFDHNEQELAILKAQIQDGLKSNQQQNLLFRDHFYKKRRVGWSGSWTIT